ncbi:MAG: hypothetical protein KA007_03270 [Candidatus Pacebacteria bacterium]|nr:hypothetical protein [Candidatus Paceibacterota bacterium]
MPNLKTTQSMTQQDKKYIESVIDHFVQKFNFDLLSYNKAYRIWFERNLHKEIIVDFLRKVNIPANVRLIQKNTSTPQDPLCKGYITLNKNNPVLFYTEAFKRIRFEICIHPERYEKFEFFITTLCHELAHLTLYSTFDKHRESEVATDLFMMAFGLHEEKKYVSQTHIETPGYISREQTQYAYEYILKKRERILNPKKTFISSLLKKFFD